MSLEKKERRMCDICKRIMSEESFYSCQRNYAYKENEYHATSMLEIECLLIMVHIQTYV